MGCPPILKLFGLTPLTRWPSGGGGRPRANPYEEDEVHYPTRPVDKDKAEGELVVHIKKATSPEESAPKQKHVRSECGDFRRRGPQLIVFAFQSVSFTPGITIPLSRSGRDYVFNQSYPMKSKRSKP